MMREWIIFALCLGVGGHIALGMVLHAPGYWPWNTAALYGLLSGLTFYVLVQVARVIWKWIRPAPTHSQKSDSGTSW